MEESPFIRELRETADSMSKKEIVDTLIAYFRFPMGAVPVKEGEE